MYLLYYLGVQDEIKEAMDYFNQVEKGEIDPHEPPEQSPELDVIPPCDLAIAYLETKKIFNTLMDHGKEE